MARIGPECGHSHFCNGGAQGRDSKKLPIYNTHMTSVFKIIEILQRTDCVQTGEHPFFSFCILRPNFILHSRLSFPCSSRHNADCDLHSTQYYYHQHKQTIVCRMVIFHFCVEQKSKRAHKKCALHYNIFFIHIRIAAIHVIVWLTVD